MRLLVMFAPLICIAIVLAIWAAGIIVTLHFIIKFW